MNRKTLSLIIITLAGVVGGPWLDGFTQPAQAAVAGANLDIGFFYDRLAPYGDWRQHAQWGWVWCPRDVAVDWRPYTIGHWIYTDDYGWLWESDEDWGWACYHYGRWDWDDDFGWFWVPGSYWGPAWVAWRTSPGLGSPTQNFALGGPFIGWCPLPPPVRWQPDVGLALNGFDLDDLPPWQWVFVETSFFDVPRLHDHILLVSRNVILVRETRPIVRFERVDGRIVNRAFSDREIEAFTHRRVTHFRVRHVDNPPAMRVFRGREGEVPLFTPRIQRGAAGLRPPERGEWERREGAERAQLQERQRAEQLRQQERFRTERAAPGAGAQQLQRRQEAERQALQAEHGRQQRSLANRQMRQREESEGARAQSNAAGPGRMGGGMEPGRGTHR